MQKIETILAEYAVVAFRNQKLTPKSLLTFARQFGKLEINAFGKHALEDYPGILKVSNIRHKNRDIGYADAGSFWHSDMSYTKTPPRLTMLYAIEIPKRYGVSLGNTVFASAVDAYDALPKETQQKLDGLIATHDFAKKKRGVKNPVKLSSEQIAENSPVKHPVVRTHPITGRKSIYVTADECTGIDDMDQSEALTLIEELASFVIKPQFQYRHKWEVGDLLIWDNCSVQHVVDRNYDFPMDRRMLHRCTVNGSIPF